MNNSSVLPNGITLLSTIAMKLKNANAELQLIDAEEERLKKELKLTNEKIAASYKQRIVWQTKKQTYESILEESGYNRICKQNKTGGNK